MCGIAGFVGHGSQVQLNKMVSAIRHRGPDDDGFLIDESHQVFLGMRRLAIIDVAAGAQPIFNADKSIGLVYNGEIYNYKDLRKDLEAKGHKFKTNSDTEVIVLGYQAYGYELFNKLNGMLAIALWDKKQEQVVLARDRMGQKPLYYANIDGVFYFASELKVFSEIKGFKKEVNLQSFIKFIDQTYIGGNDTIFKFTKLYFLYNE